MPIWPTPSCMDDRGVWRPLLDWRGLRELPSVDDPDIAAMHTRIQALFVVDWKFPAFVGAAVGLTFVSAMALVPSLPRWLFGAIMGLPISLAMSFVVAKRMSNRAKDLCDIVLKEGLCPSCGYNLYNIASQDGLVVCPECGGAWDRARVVRTREFAVVPSTTANRKLMVQSFRQQFTGLIGRDAAGRPVRLAWPVRKAQLEELDAVTREILAAQVAGGRWLRISIAAVFVVLGASEFIMLLVFWPPISGFAAFGVWLSGPLLVGLGLLVLASPLGRSPAKIQNALLRASRCPGCFAVLGASSSKDVVACQRCDVTWSVGRGHGGASR